MGLTFRFLFAQSTAAAPAGRVTAVIAPNLTLGAVYRFPTTAALPYRRGANRLTLLRPQVGEARRSSQRYVLTASANPVPKDAA